jgi:peptidyl-prolyl cis-trans isomerase A (cyclophilin A)
MTRGITGEGELITTLHTTEGDIACRLYEDKTPVTVANFIGLARGLKSWRGPKDHQHHTQDPFYDGLSFYRVIPGFIVQSGAPGGDPDAGPGYHLPDEFHPQLTHDRPGVLGMASQGPDTAGSQFYITLRAAPHLDSHHPIFGHCRNLDVVSSIARRPADANNRPEHPARIKFITFDRVDWSSKRDASAPTAN